MKYISDHTGGTTGAESGKKYKYEEGQPFDAAKGDFSHVDGVKPVAGQEESDEPEGDKVGLAKDLPGREHFIEDGRYTSDEEVQSLSKKELTDVKYIGDSTADEVMAFYQSDEPEGDKVPKDQAFNK